MLEPDWLARALFGLICLYAVAACAPDVPIFVDPSEIRSASSEKLCGILSDRPRPTLISQRIINEELERRGKRCFGKVAINRPPDPAPGGDDIAQAGPPDDAAPPVAVPPKKAVPPEKKEGTIPEIRGFGTAFAVNKGGNLVTNEHVVSGCQTTWIASGGEIYPARIVATDSVNDLAVISVPDLPTDTAARFRNGGPQLGEDLMVAGFPYATMLGVNLKTTFGNVTSSFGINDNASEFQLSAPIQPGNSGGPILSQSGAVIGIVTARLNDEYMLKSRGEIGQLINFGLKSDVVVVLLKAHRIPIEVVDAGKTLSNARLAAEALDYTFLLVCA